VNRGVLELIDAVELAISRSGSNAPREVIAEAERRIDGLRDRNGHFGEVMVVALAGGTGCGKSSLLNAIAGQDVAGVSVLRPHTQTPLAWIPRQNSEGIERLLDNLDIAQRVLQDSLPSLAFLDLPDIDSIADWHRQMVEKVLPHVDAVLWVVDPEKYHDDVIHEQVLSPVASFGDQFLFALNKIDKLSIDEIDTIREDLTTSLAHDGFKRPLIFAIAADPEFGPTRGIDDLVGYLADQVDIKRVAIGKAINDVGVILEELGAAAEVLDGGSVDFATRWPEARDLSADELVTKGGPGARHDAICRLEDFVAALAVEVGPTLGQNLRQEFPSLRVEQAVDGELADWQSTATVTARLDAALGEPLRLLLWQRAHFAATLAGAVVATHQLRDAHKEG
jgi:GTP-binding protein EngB required for normal cell division